MIYDIVHATTYRYEAPVAAARCAIRLLPREGSGQSVLSSRLEMTPPARLMRERCDFFGNRVCDAQIDAPHAKLRIEMRARVKVEREEPPTGALTPTWEAVAAQAASAQTLDAHSPAHFLYASRGAPLLDRISDYARESFDAGRPILEGAVELMRRIHGDFAYDSEATHVATPLSEAFERRRGVCQDFSHVMIAGLRGVGLPAAYVSGYLRTIPAPGMPRLEGADATHAWVSLWCGREFGWIDLDPTNALIVGDDHIVIGAGRDYADISPVDGVIFSAGKQDLSVSVDVKEAIGA